MVYILAILTVPSCLMLEATTLTVYSAYGARGLICYCRYYALSFQNKVHYVIFSLEINAYLLYT